MKSNISLEESMALLFAQETRRAAPLEKVNQYTRLVCFVLQCLQAVREPSLDPSRVCIQANNRLNSAWISLTCPHIVATSPRQTVGPHVHAAQLQGSFSRPFIHVGYRRFTRLFPTFISRPCHRRSFNVYSSRVNDFSTFPPLRWIASESFDRDSANLYRTLDVWSADKRREGKRRERERRMEF